MAGSTVKQRSQQSLMLLADHLTLCLLSWTRLAMRAQPVQSAMDRGAQMCYEVATVLPM